MRENELASPLPVLAQFSLFANAGHVVARIADSAQGAPLFGRGGTGLAFERGTQDATSPHTYARRYAFATQHVAFMLRRVSASG
jgi:hypothetical protein